MLSHSLSILDHSNVDVDAVVTELTNSLWNNPVTLWLFPLECHERQRWIEGFFYTVVQFVLRTDGIVDYPDNGDYVFICSLGKEDENDELLFFRQLEENTGPCFKRVEQLFQATTAHYPHDLPTHVYIIFFCIPGNKRGKDIFLNLFQRLAPLLCTKNIGIYAEASTYANLRLWRRIGFRQIGQAATLPENGPTFYPMYWAPE